MINLAQPRADKFHESGNSRYLGKGGGKTQDISNFNLTFLFSQLERKRFSCQSKGLNDVSKFSSQSVRGGKWNFSLFGLPSSVDDFLKFNENVLWQAELDRLPIFHGNLVLPLLYTFFATCLIILKFSCRLGDQEEA